MKRVYKYSIEVDETVPIKFYIKLPKGAEIISGLEIDSLGGGFIYAIVDPEEETMVNREVIWLGTGWDIDKDTEWKIDWYQFIGTFKQLNLVWHIWIEPEHEDICF